MSRLLSHEPFTKNPLLAEQFQQLFSASSQLGATPAGGLHRLAASREDGLARDHLKAWMQEQQLDVRIDQVGNLFGLATFDPNAPYILCGSHLDSQPTAGRFDGAYGVIAGAVTVAALAAAFRQQGITPPFNLGVVNWTNEEGARYQPSLIGSSVFIGSLAANDALAIEDRDGIALGQALQAIGYQGESAVTLPLAAYVEVHVEQGTDLTENQQAIGVVRNTWAALKLTMCFEGYQAHTGPTPMADRRDALLAAAYAITFARELADEFPGRLHSSVGRMEVYPNSPNVVPSKVTAYVEFRSREPDLLTQVLNRFDARVAQVAQQTNTTYQVLSRQLREGLMMNNRLAELAHKVCEELGLPAADSTTVAGHDAINVSKVAPSLLLFVPSRDGIAHNEAEFTRDQDLHNGLYTLYSLLGYASLGHGLAAG